MFQCPKCKTSDHLRISCTVSVVCSVDAEGNVEDSNQVGGFEWEHVDPAHCAKCEWHGNVEQMTIKDDEDDSDSQSAIAAIRKAERKE